MHAAAPREAVAEAAVGALDAVLAQELLQLGLLAVEVVGATPLGELLAGQVLVGLGPLGISRYLRLLKDVKLQLTGR